MINYSIGIVLDKEQSQIIKSKQDTLVDLFNNQDIPVNWTEEDRLYISLLSLGSNLNIIQSFLYKLRLKNFIYSSFPISVGLPKIGMTSKYKELIYLPIENGADPLRELLLKLALHLRFRRMHSFIPHITLGRVAKDLSEQEFRNLRYQVDRIKVNFAKDIDKHNDRNLIQEFKLGLIVSDWEQFKIEMLF